MKASRFNLVIDVPDTGEVILYNSLYGSQTRCTSHEYETVREILSAPDEARPSDAKIRHGLESQRHLVDSELDEMELVRTRKSAGMSDPNRLDVIVMPTLACNFACTYCYESHPASMMSDETEESIRRWLTAEMPNRKVVLLSWFGGEPLLAYERVLSLTRFAVSTARRLGSTCVTHITTNGYLLDDARIRELVGAGLLDYQITLDGPREMHDRFRMLRNGVGTFDRVFRNVVALATADDTVKVSLRVNFNHENLHSIPALLELFPQSVRAQLRIVFEPIFGEGCVSATGNIDSEEISSAMADYYRLARDLGYSIVLGTAELSAGKLVYCYAERENQAIVNFNGDVYKCSVGDFSREPRLGFIAPDGTLVKEERWHEWMEGPALFDKPCESCAHLPTCMGGCRKERICHGGTGSFCALVPTNASYMLKQLSLGGFSNLLTAANHTKE